MLVVQQLQRQIKQQSKLEQRNEHVGRANDLNSHVSVEMQKCVSAAQEKGVSSWLSALPLTKHGFAIHKGDFCDALAIRYN